MSNATLEDAIRQVEKLVDYWEAQRQPCVNWYDRLPAWDWNLCRYSDENVEIWINCDILAKRLIKSSVVSWVESIFNNGLQCTLQELPDIIYVGFVDKMVSPHSIMSARNMTYSQWLARFSGKASLGLKVRRGRYLWGLAQLFTFVSSERIDPAALTDTSLWIVRLLKQHWRVWAAILLALVLSVRTLWVRGSVAIFLIDISFYFSILLFFPLISSANSGPWNALTYWLSSVLLEFVIVDISLMLIFWLASWSNEYLIVFALCS